MLNVLGTSGLIGQKFVAERRQGIRHIALLIARDTRQLGPC